MPNKKKIIRTATRRTKLLKPRKSRRKRSKKESAKLNTKPTNYTPILNKSVILYKIYLTNYLMSNKNRLFKLLTHTKNLILDLDKLVRSSQVKKIEHLARRKHRQQVTLGENKTAARFRQARTRLLKLKHFAPSSRGNQAGLQSHPLS